MSRLIDVCRDQAKRLLEEFGAFYPFAFGLNADGTIRPISTYFGEDEPSVEDVLLHLEKALVVADNKELAEVAICLDVLTVPPGQQSKKDVLEIRLDYKDKPNSTIYIPYSKEINGGVYFDQSFEAEGYYSTLKNNMKNWQEISDNERKVFWNFIYNILLFKPYNEEKIITLPSKNKHFDISQFYNDGFNNILYEELHLTCIKWFKEMSNNDLIYALNWQHECYRFSPYLPFEKDEFDEWLIPVFPNGDYCFFLSKDLQNGIFCDGIHLSISIFGDEIIKAFEKNHPQMLIG